MKASELRKKSPADLTNELIALRKEQLNMRMQRGIEQASQTHLLKNVRKNIARVKTILGEKEGKTV